MHSTRRKFVTGSAAAAASAGLWNIMTKSALAAPAVPPKRLIIFYWPEGCHQPSHWPGNPGDLNINMDAKPGQGGYSLQPLKPYEKDTIVIRGLNNRGNGGEPHGRVVQSALAGQGRASFDQEIGKALKGNATFDAVVSTMFGRHAHNNPTYLCPVRINGGSADPSWNPMTTYNKVFPNGVDGMAPPGDPSTPGAADHRLESKLELLGSVREHLKLVKCQGGDLARDRLESYLGSIETIELATQGLVGDVDDPSVSSPDAAFDFPAEWANTNGNDEYWRKSDNFAALAKIQIDLTVAAMATNRSRVGFMQFSGSGTEIGIKNGQYDGMHYRKAVPGLQGNGQLNDHKFGHGGNQINQAIICNWYYTQVVYLIKRLQAIPDVEGGTLFDNTLIMTASEFGHTNHKGDNVPYTLIGNPGGVLKSQGKFLNAGGRDHTDMFLAVAKAFGTGMTEFGGTSKSFDEIIA